MINKKIAVIDCDSVAYYVGHPNKVLDENGEPTRSEDGKRFIYIDKTNEELESSAKYMMNKILKSGEFTGYIGFIKGKNTIGNRIKVNPSYKSNRNLEKPKWWDTVKEILITKYNVNEVNNMEVDDAVNITRLKVPDSYICAIDKDLLNLEGLHYNWKNDKWIDVLRDEANYFFWKDMIIGQAGDGVKGIPGIGEYNKIFKDNLFIPDKSYVLDLYCIKFREQRGIEEFYKNYMSLKIKSYDNNFTIPQIIKFTSVEDVEEKVIKGW